MTKQRVVRFSLITMTEWNTKEDSCQIQNKKTK